MFFHSNKFSSFVDKKVFTEKRKRLDLLKQLMINEAATQGRNIVNDQTQFTHH